MHVLERLIDACGFLSGEEVPYMTGVDDKNWTQTLRAMRDYLDRQLDRYEVTALSLTRNYGPLPALSESDKRTIRLYVWPGTVKGLISWDTLALRLKELDACSWVAV